MDNTLDLERRLEEEPGDADHSTDRLQEEHFILSAIDDAVVACVLRHIDFFYSRFFVP